MNANCKQRSKWTKMEHFLLSSLHCFNKSNIWAPRIKKVLIEMWCLCFVLNGDRSPRWAWGPYLYRWGFIPSAGAKQLSPCWRLRLFPIRRLEVHPKHNELRTWLLRTIYTAISRAFCQKHRLGLQHIYISNLDDTDCGTEIDVIPRNEKPTQRVKRCLGDRENVSGRAFSHWPKMSPT